MSDAHAEGDGHAAGRDSRRSAGSSRPPPATRELSWCRPVTPPPSPRGSVRRCRWSAAAHADPHSWHRSAERYAALLDRIDAGWSRDGRIPAERTVKSSVAGERRMTSSALRVGLVVPRFAPFHGGMETYAGTRGRRAGREGRRGDCRHAGSTGCGTASPRGTRRIHRRAPPPASRRHLRRALAVGRACGIAVWPLRRRVGAQLPHTAGLAGGGAGEGPTRVHPALPRGWPHSAAPGPAPGLPSGRPATHGGEPPNRGGHRRRGGPGSAGLPPPGPARKNHRGSAGGGRSGAWTAAVSRRVATSC